MSLIYGITSPYIAGVGEMASLDSCLRGDIDGARQPVYRCHDTKGANARGRGVDRWGRGTRRVWKREHKTPIDLASMRLWQNPDDGSVCVYNTGVW